MIAILRTEEQHRLSAGFDGCRIEEAKFRPVVTGTKERLV
jgi:hypothetical protein